MDLTPPQRRYLLAIVEADKRQTQKHYNGRGRRPLQALATAGLIEYEFDLIPHLNGRYTELFICWPTQSGRNTARELEASGEA